MPKPWTIDGSWAKLDDWGWLPGMDPDPDDIAARKRLSEFCRENYRAQFHGHTIHPSADRAFRESVALARSHGAQVGLLFLPESARFQSWYPPEVENAARAHLANLSRELDVPVIDTRNWIDECYLADGFHLSRIGAGIFTTRLGTTIANVFPDRRDEP
jgi:hypothetical protein